MATVTAIYRPFFIAVRNTAIGTHWGLRLYRCLKVKVKKFNFMLEIDILRNYSQKHLGVLRAKFLGCGCPIDFQVPYWLRLRLYIRLTISRVPLTLA